MLDGQPQGTQMFACTPLTLEIWTTARSFTVTTTGDIILQNAFQLWSPCLARGADGTVSIIVWAGRKRDHFLHVDFSGPTVTVDVTNPPTKWYISPLLSLLCIFPVNCN